MAKIAIFKMAAAAISFFGDVTVIWFNAEVYPISSKSDDFSLTYVDLAICKMAAVRHLGFVVTSQYSIVGHIFVVKILSEISY